MKLKHLIASAAMAFASFGASAAILSATLTSQGGGIYTAGFESTVTDLNFTDTINFLPTNLGGFANGSIVTIALDLIDDPTGISNIDFTSVKLNGNAFALFPNGQAEGGFLARVSVNAPLQLVIQGTSGGNASYGGTLNLRVVPEPGILALLGIAGLGLALTRRRKETTA